MPLCLAAKRLKLCNLYLSVVYRCGADYPLRGEAPFGYRLLYPCLEICRD